MKIFNPDYAADLLQALLWQYDNAPRLQKLLQHKQNWYNANNTSFWTDWFANVFNINTANDFGLTVWGKLLRVERTYTVNGQPYSLDTEQYRLLLKGRLLYLGMNGSVPIQWSPRNIMASHPHSWVMSTISLASFATSRRWKA